MSKTKNPLKPAAVFREFNRLVKEYREKYGEIATRIDKNYLYEQVAKPFLISPKYAGQLIRHVMKHQSEYSFLKEDIDDVMAAMKKVKTPMDKYR